MAEEEEEEKEDKHEEDEHKEEEEQEEEEEDCLTKKCSESTVPDRYTFLSNIQWFLASRLTVISKLNYSLPNCLEEDRWMRVFHHK